MSDDERQITVDMAKSIVEAIIDDYVTPLTMIELTSSITNVPKETLILWMAQIILEDRTLQRRLHIEKNLSE